MKCPSCGSLIKVEKFCTSCGTKLSASEKSTKSSNNSKVTKSFVSPKILGILTLSTLGLIALFIALQVNKSGVSSSTNASVKDSSPIEIVKENPTSETIISASPTSSPTTSKKQDLDDTKIVGNLIYIVYENFVARDGAEVYGYFSLFSEDFKTKDERIGNIFYQARPINLVESTSIDRSNQLRDLISKSVSVDVDSGSGFAKWENQSISCDSDELWGCNISLVDFQNRFMKNYKSKQVVKVQYNVSDVEQLQDASLYVTNGSIETYSFEPATCSMIYEKMTNPPKDHVIIDKYYSEDFKTDLYNLLISSGDC